MFFLEISIYSLNFVLRSVLEHFIVYEVDSEERENLSLRFPLFTLPNRPFVTWTATDRLGRLVLDYQHLLQPN